MGLFPFVFDDDETCLPASAAEQRAASQKYTPSARGCSVDTRRVPVQIDDPGLMEEMSQPKKPGRSGNNKIELTPRQLMLRDGWREFQMNCRRLTFRKTEYYVHSTRTSLTLDRKMVQQPGSMASQ
jgi:hypothetical protein